MHLEMQNHTTRETNSAALLGGFVFEGSRCYIINEVKKTIKIIEYSPEVGALQDSMISEIKELLPASKILPIGSMAVPMAGKEEIDLLVVSAVPERDSQTLAANGFRKGPIEKDVHYLKASRGAFEIDVQVVSPGHHAIEYHSQMLGKLRRDESLRNRYAEFKRSLNGLTPVEYKEKKSTWIRENLRD